MTKSSLSSVLEAIGILKSFPEKELASVLADQALQKAAESLTPAEMVTDHWTEGHVQQAASKEEIKTGPSQMSSGGGAEKMIGEYATPQPQLVHVKVAEDLARHLAPIHTAMKAQADVIRTIVTSLETLKSAVVGIALQKAEKEPEEDEEGEGDKDLEKSSAEKAKSLVTKAQSLLAKAEEWKDKAEDEEGMEKKDCKAKAKDCRKAAAKLLVKARMHALVAKSHTVELRKSIRTMVEGTRFLKADMDAYEEDDEEDEDEAKAKSRLGDAMGNQVAAQDSSNGNQAAVAAKSINDENIEKINATLKGLGALQMSLSDMLQHVSNSARSTPMTPVLAKADIPTIDTIFGKIAELEDDQMIGEADATIAKGIVGRLRLVGEGKIDAGRVADEIKKASPIVQNIFNGLRAAA